jgi:hypothetical protein
MREGNGDVFWQLVSRARQSGPSHRPLARENEHEDENDRHAVKICNPATGMLLNLMKPSGGK